MAEDSEQSKGFQVKDRRRFTDTGDVREDAPKTEEPVFSADAGTPTLAPEPPVHTHEPLDITLSTFLMSLSTQALMCLGEIPNPLTDKTEMDLDAVREFIDIISMLQEKTRGNVDPAEARLFEKVLYDLRIRFVEKARK
ncbi:MAG: DUF1844 domain-containing protein [Candidatus Binatia bacterium]